MIDRVRDFLSTHRRVIWVAAAGVVVIWVTFIDSHSLLRRMNWHREAESLKAQNEALRQEIEELEQELERDLTDEEIERIAREQYGMQREGETVHPVTPGE